MTCIATNTVLEPQPMDSAAFPVLLADIGGTNTRFRVLDAPGMPLRAFPTFPTADYPTLEKAVCAVVLGAGTAPKRAIVAAAGPIKADGLDLTNAHWVIRPAPFLATTGIEKLVLLNDFEAQALALPALGAGDVTAIGPVSQTRDHTRAVIGPGTGLGVGTLVRAGGVWVPVAGEGGHVDFGPRTEREAAVRHHLDAIDGRISAEQVLCGAGLVNLYRAICLAEGAEPLFQDPSTVSTAALVDWERGNATHAPLSHAQEALDLFCTGLGRVAGDLALTTYAAGGVYLGGGITLKILPFLQSSGFRAAFEDKAPHRAFMESVATLAITADLPALAGLSAYAQNPTAYSLDVHDRTWTV